MLHIKFTELPPMLKTCDIAHCHELRRPRIWHTTDMVYIMSSLTVLLSFHSSVYLHDERYY